MAIGSGFKTRYSGKPSLLLSDEIKNLIYLQLAHVKTSFEQRPVFNPFKTPLGSSTQRPTFYVGCNELKGGNRIANIEE
jgi:hypothetical protein